MPMYEIMYIIQPDVEGDLLEEAIGRIQELLEKEGARVVDLKRIGKRRLAYEINDFKEGFYVLLNVEAESTVVPVLEHFFKVTEGYLRFIVIRLEEEKDKIKDDDKEIVEENAEGA